MKDTNPKDAIGTTKLPLHLIPLSAQVHTSLAHLDGMLKYGAWNWRVAGVRSSIYVGAAMRHILKWWQGRNRDADSGLHELAHAIACLNILIDSEHCGNLNDDRPPVMDDAALVDWAQGEVERLMALHRDRNPTHYTEQGQTCDQPATD